MLSFIKKYPLSLSLASAITLACLIPIPDIPVAADVPLFDKWTHMLMYAALCTTIWAEHWRQHAHSDLRTHLRNHAASLALWAVVAPVAMSGTLELLQAYATTYRSGEWLDMAANSIGVGIGTVAGIAIGHFIKSPKQL